MGKVIKQGRLISAILKSVGIANEEWGLQYNLVHGSLNPELGMRHGLDDRLRLVLREKDEWQLLLGCP